MRKKKVEVMEEEEREINIESEKRGFGLHKMVEPFTDMLNINCPFTHHVLTKIAKW